MRSRSESSDGTPPSLWAATATPAAPLETLSGQATADVAVIGAGYTGLSTALHLAEQGVDVAVLERHQPGFGASGRNGGQVNAGLKHGRAALQAMFGAECGSRMYAIAADAPRFTFDLVERLGIACAARRSGTLRLAHHPRAVAALEQAGAALCDEGVPVRLLDRAETAAEVGTSVYLAGLFDPRGGSVHPLQYARGLCRAALAAGVRIHPGSPALSLSRTGGRWLVGTPAGQVAADRVVLATNGYTDGLWPGLRRTVLPVHSFQIATAPIEPERARAILPSRASAYDSRRLILYFRRTDDDRLVLGGRASFSVAERASDYRELRRVLVGLFPDLADVPIEFGWAGRVAITADFLPRLHEPAPGLVATLGYNGRGVAMATRMGKVVADRLTGTDTASFPASPVRPIPLHAFRQPVLHAVMQYHRLMDRLGR